MTKDWVQFQRNGKGFAKTITTLLLPGLSTVTGHIFMIYFCLIIINLSLSIIIDYFFRNLI